MALTVMIEVSSSDDLSPPSSIGYELRVVAGVVPSDVRALIQPHRPVGDRLILSWDGRAADLPFDATVTLVAVDEAGNRSAPSVPRRLLDLGLPATPPVNEAAATPACTRGEPTACLWLGQRARHGLGRPRVVDVVQWSPTATRSRRMPTGRVRRRQRVCVREASPRATDAARRVRRGQRGRLPARPQAPRRHHARPGRRSRPETSHRRTCSSSPATPTRRRRAQSGPR